MSSFGASSVAKGAEEWDIIVVGSGSNGLTAAAYLAAAGKRVLVLERMDYPGGGVASFNLVEPGFKSERHSAIHQLLLLNPLIRDDELHIIKRFGLKYLPLDPCYAIVFEDGVLPLYKERKRTVEAISKFSVEDGEAWNRFADDAVQITKLLVPSMFEPPADISAQIASSPVAAVIAQAAESSTIDIISRYFKNDIIRVAILRFTTEIQLAHPQTKGTGLMAYLGVGMMELSGLCVPEGGGSGFTNAVLDCIKFHGGQLRLQTEVTKVIVEQGRAVGVRTTSGDIRAKDAVVGQIHPYLLDRLVDGIDPAIIKDAKAAKTSEFSLFAIHAALKEPLKFKAGGEANRVVMNTVCPGSLSEMLTSYDAMAEGKLPDTIMVGASCISNGDPTRAPPGKSLLHAVVMVRSVLADGGFHGWEAIKHDFTQRVFASLSKYTTNLTPDLVSSYHVVTPTDHETDSPSFQGGDICGLSMASNQLGLARPTPALAQYRVPGVKGLYLAGPFMHPGGGVWGGGRPVAMRVLEDLGIDFKKLFVQGGPGPRL